MRPDDPEAAVGLEFMGGGKEKRGAQTVWSDLDGCSLISNWSRPVFGELGCSLHSLVPLAWIFGAISYLQLSLSYVL